MAPATLMPTVAFKNSMSWPASKMDLRQTFVFHILGQHPFDQQTFLCSKVWLFICLVSLCMGLMNLDLITILISLRLGKYSEVELLDHTVVLLLIFSRMISEVEHLSTHTCWVIPMPSLEKCLFKSFTYFKKKKLFLLLSCINSWNILDINSVRQPIFATLKMCLFGMRINLGWLFSRRKRRLKSLSFHIPLSYLKNLDNGPVSGIELLLKIHTKNM